MLAATTAGEETYLTNVEVEAFQAPISETDDRILLANIALGLMFRAFGGNQPMEHGQPHDRLRFSVKPAKKVHRLNFAADQLTSAVETRSHTRFHIAAAERTNFSENAWNLNKIVQEEAQFALIGHSFGGIGD